MSADIKSLRTRIKSVDSTLHLTRAMGLVASSKIRRATDAMNRTRQYAAAFREAIASLTACPECARSPYMQEREAGRTRLIVIAGDRGLAGGYNANVFRFMRELPEAEIIAIGKRSVDRYGSGVLLAERFHSAEALAIAREQCADFREGKFDRLGIVSTKYVSMMTQEVTLTWLLPLTRNESVPARSMIFEPDEMAILDAAVPEYVAGILVAAARESFACEVAARRNAMDSAGKNAQEMIDALTLAYNRARQGSITQEITEIVAGGNA